MVETIFLYFIKEYFCTKLQKLHFSFLSVVSNQERVIQITGASKYSCNKITKTWIQISRQNWNGFFSNTSIVSRSKTEWKKHPKNKKLASNSQLQSYQILTNYDQMLILCFSYFISTVSKIMSCEESLSLTQILHLYTMVKVVCKI